MEVFEGRGGAFVDAGEGTVGGRGAEEFIGVVLEVRAPADGDAVGLAGSGADGEERKCEGDDWS